MIQRSDPSPGSAAHQGAVGSVVVVADLLHACASIAYSKGPCILPARSRQFNNVSDQHTNPQGRSPAAAICYGDDARSTRGEGDDD